MARDKGGVGQDVVLRLAGAGLIAVAALAVARLLRSVAAMPPHDASAGELALAAVAFLGASGGAVLLLLGRHVHDRITVSQRWATVVPDRPRAMAGRMRDRSVRTR